jgi:hypothetical protein
MRSVPRLVPLTLTLTFVSVLALAVSLFAPATAMTPSAGHLTGEAVPLTDTARAGAPSPERAGQKRFPTRRTAGVPVGWKPKRTLDSTLTVSQPGAVVEDIRIVNGDLNIAAPNVTVRRVEVQGGVINNFAGSECASGLKLIAVTVRRAPGQVTEGDFSAIGVGGYTARRVEIVGLPEGFRVGGVDDNCGPVKVINSFALVTSPDVCEDWHGDGLQGYDGDSLTLRRSVLKMRMREDCGGTAPFFYPADQGNTSVNIDGLIVDGGGYPFRLGMPGTVRGLHIVQGSWVFGPIDVKCSVLSSWEADIAVLKGGQPKPVRGQRCNTEEGY